MKKLGTIVKYVRNYGLGSVVTRLGYEFALRSGAMRRRFPARPWSDFSHGDLAVGGNVELDPEKFRKSRLDGTSPRFFFSPGNLPSLKDFDTQKIVESARQVLDGYLTYFSRHKVRVGECPDWLKNPFTQQRCSANVHWTAMSDFDLEQGDIKFIWEASRFAWVFPLVRAYAVNGNEAYAEHFWRWVSDWRSHNPPNMGPNFRCGQECAIRCLALCFAVFAFLKCRATTSDRLAEVIEMLAVHGERIEGNIAYARWQKNNHAVSEANGLYTLGVLFPELKGADRWRRLGKTVLEEEGLRQIYPDGSYIQHSMNYHRVMLQTYLWAVRLGELNGDSFSAELTDRLVRATEFIYQMQDPETGRVPNYGSNDGALVLPLNECDYRDYRALTQSGWGLLRRERLHPSGAWDEDLRWLLGQVELAPTSRLSRQSAGFESGGYYTLRNGKSWGMIRCHSYRDRPAQADMLHVDLWAEGVNLLRDSGSYSYYASPPWDHFFASSRAHNCPRIDGREQMTKGPRFTWFDWTRAEPIHFERKARKGFQWFTGRLLSYERLPGCPRIRRTLCAAECGMWLIIDDILGQGRHVIEQFWQIDSRVQVVLNDRDVLLEDKVRRWKLVRLAPSEGHLRLMHGEESPEPGGWVSEYYGEKQIAWTVVHRIETELPQRLITILAPMESTWMMVDGNLRGSLSDGSQVSVDLAVMKSDRPITDARIERN